MLKTKSGKKINGFKDLPSTKKLEKSFDGKGSVKVGFPAKNSETQSTEDGVTALFKATVNNFGLGVPKRPFMQVAFAKNQKKYRALIASKIGKLPNGKILAQLGVIGEGDVKQAIIAMKSPPNSAVTIARKGDNNPLIDSSHMVNSVTHAVVKK